MARLDLGFVGSIRLRLAVAGAFLVLATLGVRVVDGASAVVAPTAAPSVAPAATVHGRLVLETTFPVARWTVQAQGRALAGVAAAQRWEGEADASATIFVQAEPEDAASAAAVALRWSCAGRGGMLWGEGGVADTVRLAGGEGR